ncbi:hypothetical protein DSM100688_2167 [Bifidobacterium ramosum]|uniref:Uncharacterized protein n=1 Tax=Bifidobacterium ramosum TaxID=1798158 RepID=A0A6L4WYK4_9BIFI|nr:hypothetical protein DSM100688_2167 [Bifidobacterium ramosum]
MYDGVPSRRKGVRAYGDRVHVCRKQGVCPLRKGVPAAACPRTCDTPGADSRFVPGLSYS